MSYKAGDEVIVTSEGVNRVGVIIDRRVINKLSVYDVLLENRSALCMISTAPKHATRINRTLTSKLCGEEGGFTVESNVPYRELVETESLPFTKS